MKKLLLSVLALSFNYFVNSQVVVRGISPAPIVNNYNFTWADPAGGDWGTPDLTIPGTFVQGEIMLVNDGSSGTNAQGNPISAEGCNTLVDNFGGVVSSLSIIDGGSGYSNSTNVSSTLGSGNGLTLNLTVSNAVNSLNNTSLNPGSGYSNSQNAVTTTSGSGTGLTLNVTAESIGQVYSLNSSNIGLFGGYSDSTGTSTTTDGLGIDLTLDITASPIIDTVSSLDSLSLNPGSGYTSNLNVSTLSNNPNASGLTVDIAAETIGEVINWSPNSQGSNYVDSSEVSTQSVNGTGMNLTVGYTTLAGVIDSIFIVNPGYGYNLNDTIIILAGDSTASIIIDSVSLGQLISVSINNPGSGYAVGDTISIAGGQNGIILVESIGTTGGNITSVLINEPGQGYEVGDSIFISGGSAYVLVDSVSQGKITSVQINQSGNGYAVNDTIYISNGTNGSILVQSIIDSISSVTVQNGGTGYSIGDTISVSTGNGNALAKVESFKGFIAVIYRNTCEFGKKALNAQNAGAIAAIIVNRDPEAVEMGGGANGVDVTIPVVMLSSLDGAILVNEMANGPVEVFIGNKQNLFANDGGSSNDQALISRYGSVPLNMANNSYTFGVGLQMYNFGSTDNTFTVSAKIKDPNGITIYDELVNALVVSGDTLPIFNGATESFPDFSFTSTTPAIIGEYTLTYTIAIDGAVDESDYDNEFVSSFNVTQDVLSLARQDATTGKVLVNSFPSNALSQYRACMMLQEDVYPSASTGIGGLYFAVSSTNDTIPIANEDITADVFEWNDGWTSINGDWAANITFDALDPVGGLNYVCASDADKGIVVYAPFASPIQLNNSQRYLICLQTYNPEISFGFDEGITYEGNVGIYQQPISPVEVDDATNGLSWYSGWSGTNAFSIGLKIVGNAGIDEQNTVSGIAYPNPANESVTVSIESTGNADLTISDVSGKIVHTGSLNLINGKADVNISTLDSGIYIFNVELENGKTSQFNVVKK